VAFAQLCSAWKKPDAQVSHRRELKDHANTHVSVIQTVMRQAAIPAFLNPMEFTKIRFLGGKLGDAMAKEYEANTVGDML
jgi:DNA polymerase eta